MKKAILIAMIAVFALTVGTFPVFAGEAKETSGATWETPHEGFTEWLNNNEIDHTHEYEDKDTHKDQKSAEDLKAGVKADAPNVIRLTKNTTIGVEGGKDLVKTNAKEGWFVFGKVTWTGTLFDFSKK